MRRGILSFVGLVLVAGCSSTDAPPDLTPLPKVSHPRAEAPKDRDEQAVLAALRQLDACALLDPAAAVPGYPPGVLPVPDGPHRCVIFRKNGDDEIHVVLGAPFDMASRFGTEVVAIGGVKAYLRDSSDFCDVNVPVNFRLAVRFRARKGVDSASDGQMCGPAKGFAQYAVTRLAEPDGARPGLGRPLVEWDACQLLSAALGDNPDGYRTVNHDPMYGVDGCGADKERPDRLSPAMKLTIAYDADPGRGTSVRTIGGRPVRVSDLGGSSGCILTWSIGRARPADSRRSDQVIQLHAQDCARSEAAALAVLAKLGQGPSAPAAPQRPLTYRPDEPDVSVPGACVDFDAVDDPRRCQPYVEVPVPSGRTRILLAAEADPHVLCALTREAVAKEFGDRLKPVAAGTRCVYVEPNHAIELHVMADPRGTISVAHDEEVIDVLGHPGYRKDHASPGNTSHEFGVWAGRGKDTGTLRFVGEFRFPRGSDGKATPDVSLVGKLEPVVAAVLAKYFAE